MYVYIFLENVEKKYSKKKLEDKYLVDSLEVFKSTDTVISIKFMSITNKHVVK